MYNFKPFQHKPSGSARQKADVVIRTGGQLAVSCQLLAEIGSPSSVVMLYDPDYPRVFAMRPARNEDRSTYRFRDKGDPRYFYRSAMVSTFLRFLGLELAYRRCTATVKDGLIIVTVPDD